MVNLYTYSTFSNPKHRKGVILNVLETEVNGKEHHKTYYLRMEGSSMHRSWLMAAVDGMARIKEGNEVTLYTDSAYVAYGRNWLEKWRASDWKTARGEEIKNRDLWERLFDLMKSRKTLILLCAEHPTREWQRWEARKIVNEVQKTR